MRSRCSDSEPADSPKIVMLSTVDDVRSDAGQPSLTPPWLACGIPAGSKPELSDVQWFHWFKVCQVGIVNSVPLDSEGLRCSVFPSSVY